MSRNKISRKFKAKPDKIAWNTICPPNEYRVFNQEEASTLGIIPINIADKVNTVIVGASGSLDNTIMYFANFCRIDKNYIDQEPYIEVYESGSVTPKLNGILHHADFKGRTTKLSSGDLQIIAASGSSAEIQFLAKPSMKAGTLDELKFADQIDGFNYSWMQGEKHK